MKEGGGYLVEAVEAVSQPLRDFSISHILGIMPPLPPPISLSLSLSLSKYPPNILQIYYKLYLDFIIFYY